MIVGVHGAGIRLTEVCKTRQQPHRAICTAPVSLGASRPAKVEAAFELGRDAWGLAIVKEP